MIYKDGERLKPSDKQREKLKEMFPTFFREKDPQPLKMKYLPTMIKKGPEGNDIMPPAIHLCNRFTLDDGDGRAEYVFTAQAPRKDKNGELIFDDGSLVARHNRPLQPKKDVEKLVFLMFYSSEVVNGFAPEKSKTPKVMIVSKQSEAKAILDERTLRANVEALLISDARIPDEKVKTLGSVFNIQEEDPDVLRTIFLNMADSRTGDFKERFLASVNSDYLGVRKIVDECIDNEVLRTDKENHDWVKLVGEDYEFFVKYGPVNAKDPKAFLTNYLIGKPSEIDKLRRVLRSSATGDKTIEDFHSTQKDKVKELVSNMDANEFEAFFTGAEGFRAKWKEEMKDLIISE